MRVVPFSVEIPPAERDPHFDEHLQAEADAVLAWAVAGWIAYRDCGLAEPPAVLVATDAYQKASDTVARFIDDECSTSSPVLKSTTTQLHEAFERWRVSDGAEPMSRKAFGLALDRLSYPVTNKARDGRWRGGIALRVEVDDAA